MDAVDFPIGPDGVLDMIIDLSPDLEARLAALAARDGRKVDDLAKEAIARLLDDEARFAEAVRLGSAAADRDDFIESRDVWAGV